MKNIFVILSILIIAALAAHSEDADALFQKANDFYQNKKYQQAVETYEAILEKGQVSEEIYYNLGNAYYRLNNIPEAILNYERAKLLAPDDEDIDFNLKIANLKTIDQIESKSDVFFIEWYKSLRDIYSSDSWAAFSIVIFFITSFLGILFLYSRTPFYKKLSFTTALAALLLFVLTLLLTADKYQYEKDNNTAIIFASVVYVKSSPDESGTDLLILHEGTKIQILDSVNKWKKIRIADGNVGWIPEETIKEI